MEVTIGETIRIDHPTERMLNWCGQNLILDNPDYAKKVRMGFWTGNTPKDIRLYKRIGDTLIIPYGCLQHFPLKADEDIHFKTSFPDPVKVDYGSEKVPLYDYQKLAVNEMFFANHGILQAKAGSGKTQMGIALIKKYGKRALWLTHTIDLLNQSKARAEQYIDKSLIGTITAGKVDISDGVTFATVQTLAKQDLREFRDVWDVVIVDAYNAELDDTIVKRIIAVGGQTVDIDFFTGTVYVDGTALDEPYTKEPTYTAEGIQFPVTLKENEVFVMGDNRNHSTDSRSYRLGPVDEQYIQGKAVFLLFPGKTPYTEKLDFSRIGLIK